MNLFILRSRLACFRLAASIRSLFGGTKPVFTSGVFDAPASRIRQ